MRHPANPFQVTTLARGEEFADRTEEVARLRAVWETPGSKLVMYGDRRMGKTATMDVAADQARRPRRPVVVVNLATAVGLEDAVRRLLAAVQQAIGRSWKTVLHDLAAALRFRLSLTPNPDGTATPSFELQLEPGASANRPALFTDTLDAIEQELARRKLTLGLGLDEFQRLLLWGGEEIEWALKASLERHRHISYVLAGSARSLIEEMVTDRHRALWKATETLAVGPIPVPAFAAWIVARSRASGVPLTEETALAVVALGGPRTRDVVLLAGTTWEDARTTGHADPARAMDAYIASTTALHERQWRGCTDREQRILRALAADPGLAPTSAAARERFHLGAPSTVAKALGALVGAELLARQGGRYQFDDPFFRRWVELNALPDLGLPPPERGTPA
jgi:hypothetical protein